MLRIKDLEQLADRANDDKTEAENTAARLQSEVLTLQTAAAEETAKDSTIARLFDSANTMKQILTESEAQVTTLTSKNKHLQDNLDHLAAEMRQDKDKFEYESQQWQEKFIDLYYAKIKFAKICQAKES